MTGHHTHERKPDPVAAILWTGYNFPEIEQFFADWMPALVADEQGPYNEPDEGWPDTKFTYNTVDYYDGDDEHVDPGNWLVVHTDIPEGSDTDFLRRLEHVYDKEFRQLYQEVSR